MLTYKKTGYEDYFMISSKIVFDDAELFCGRTHVHLLASKSRLEIEISIKDEDDFDRGLVYHVNEETFNNIIHELVCWMNDHENGIITGCNFFSDEIFDFFPDLGCKRRRC